MKQKQACVVGVDVGTGSARAAVFDLDGKRKGLEVTPIRMWRAGEDVVEQSSDDIWHAVCRSVKGALKQSGCAAGDVVGLGFDATCSLVVLDREARPLTVSPSGDNERNIIVWMDHRAVDQTARINAMRHRVLRYVGGRISPEMQPPKLLWLKEKLPDTFKRAGFFFDLPDYLGFRATGDETRSLCTTVCKWTYQGHLNTRARNSANDDSIGRWDASFWEDIGLREFPREDSARIGRRVRPMGDALGSGLTQAAARELGLQPGTAVAVGIIDAHAGGLGLLGIRTGKRAVTQAQIEERLALIGGTSSCHMTASREARFIRGIWGPYYSAMIPGMWLTEGGQSATGALIDHVIFSHRRGAELSDEARKQKTSVYTLLDNLIDDMAKRQGVRHPAELTADRHVLPYFHGNRSPRADPSLRGVVSGRSLDDSVEDLAVEYYATVQAIAYGTRHILETMNAKGYRIREILACGGGTKSDVYLREHADAAGCSIALAKEPEAVLLGAAMLGAVAAGKYPSVMDAMQEMNAPGRIIAPAKGKVASYHERKYKAFHAMYRHLMSIRGIMME